MLPALCPPPEQFSVFRLEQFAGNCSGLKGPFQYALPVRGLVRAVTMKMTRAALLGSRRSERDAFRVQFAYQFLTAMRPSACKASFRESERV